MVSEREGEVVSGGGGEGEWERGDGGVEMNRSLGVGVGEEMDEWDAGMQLQTASIC